jgi:AcrR family transcriptional regulator
MSEANGSGSAESAATGIEGAEAEPAAEGLRARKRAAARSAIERTALDLALEHGYENVTVEMICEASTVSQRTFFNYFGSKEGAILGSAPRKLSDEAAAAFVATDSPRVLTDLVRLILSSLDVQPDPERFRLRRQVFAQSPELMGKQLERITELEAQAVQLVLDRFAHQGRTVETTPDLEDEARMTVSLVVSVMRYTMQSWVRGGSTGDRMGMVEKAVELIGRVAAREAA